MPKYTLRLTDEQVKNLMLALEMVDEPTARDINEALGDFVVLLGYEWSKLPKHGGKRTGSGRKGKQIKKEYTYCPNWVESVDCDCDYCEEKFYLTAHASLEDD